MAEVLDTRDTCRGCGRLIISWKPELFIMALYCILLIKHESEDFMQRRVPTPSHHKSTKTIRETEVNRHSFPLLAAPRPQDSHSKDGPIQAHEKQGLKAPLNRDEFNGLIANKNAHLTYKMQELGLPIKLSRVDRKRWILEKSKGERAMHRSRLLSTSTRGSIQSVLLERDVAAPFALRIEQLRISNAREMERLMRFSTP